ncbi:MAG: hypothetical protein AB7T63_14120 [Planctomycetota bacterium]
MQSSSPFPPQALPGTGDLVRALPRPACRPFVEPDLAADDPEVTRLYRVAGMGLAAYGVRDGDGLVVRRGRVPEHGDLVVVDALPPGVSHLDGRGASTPEGAGEAGPTLWVWRDGRPPLLVTAFLTAIVDGPLDPAASGVVVAVLRRSGS